MRKELSMKRTKIWRLLENGVVGFGVEFGEVSLSGLMKDSNQLEN